MRTARLSVEDSQERQLKENLLAIIQVAPSSIFLVILDDENTV